MVLSNFEKHYIAEESLGLYKGDFKHLQWAGEDEELDEYFERYCPQLKRFIPNEQMQEAYPDDF